MGESFTKYEAAAIHGMIYISAVILIGVLVGLSYYGIDLRTVFFGIPENAYHEASRGIIALEGAIVAVTLLFGSVLVAGITALIINRKP